MGYQVPDEIRGVLFDLDDTLTDYAGARDAAVLAWTATMPGWPLSEGATVARWVELEDRWFARFASGELDLAGQRVGRIRDFLPGAACWTTERALQAFDEVRQICEVHWRPFPDARDALDRALASGRRVGVLTNGETRYQRRKLVEMGLADERVVLLASSDLPAGKPDPRAFEAAVAALGTRAAQTLMIGDNPVTDVAGARAAGLVVCHLCRDATEPAAENWVGSLAEIEF